MTALPRLVARLALMPIGEAARSVWSRLIGRIRRSRFFGRALAGAALPVAGRETGPIPSGGPVSIDATSPFAHFQSVFDAVELVNGFAVDTAAIPDKLTNAFGVRIDPKFFPDILGGRGGEVEPIPIPANWHADVAEFAAAFRAVQLAGPSFTMAELGCGWGCWMNNTGAVARRSGRRVHLIGVEGDTGHVAFAREAMTDNGFAPSEYTLVHGVAASRSGIALFPTQAASGTDWGLEPVFGASKARRVAARASGGAYEVPMIRMNDLLKGFDRVDLLHVDIQGGEAELVRESIGLLSGKIAYVVVGTHSREIEGRLFDTFCGAGWRLEIERPALLHLGPGRPVVAVDGVQGWRNPRLLPAT